MIELLTTIVLASDGHIALSKVTGLVVDQLWWQHHQPISTSCNLVQQPCWYWRYGWWSPRLCPEFICSSWYVITFLIHNGLQLLGQGSFLDAGVFYTLIRITITAVRIRMSASLALQKDGLHRLWFPNTWLGPFRRSCRSCWTSRLWLCILMATRAPMVRRWMTRFVNPLRPLYSVWSLANCSSPVR